MDDDDGAYFYGAPGTHQSYRDDERREYANGNGGVGDDEQQARDEEASRFVDELEAALLASLIESKTDGKLSYASIAKKPVDAEFEGGSYALDTSSSVSGSNSSQSAQVARPQDTRPLCTYFMAGGCRFGDSCRFRHAAADPAAVDFFESEIERLISADRIAASALDATSSPSASPLPSPKASGSGAGGGDGSASEDAFAADTERWLASGMANRLGLIDAAIAAGLCYDAEDAEVALAMAERNVSKDMACSVCMEEVTAAPGRRFGLLSNCTHCFCLACIREWRGRIDLPVETTRSCPVCRKLSYLVIPCDRFIADEGRKAVVSKEYHSSQKTIPCKHYNYGKGSCPFGTSCFYAHLNPDGTPAVAPKHTIRLDAEGKVGVGRSFKLNEFLFR